MKREKIYIFDTTLRDGEQSGGVSLEVGEKLEIAKQLAKLGVDIIEAGFPIASQGDFEAVSAIAKNIDGPVICGLARVLPSDINRAAEALKPAKRKRIHVFLATSKIHMEQKLRKPKEDILKMAVDGVKLAKEWTDDVEFSPEDASRSEKNFLYEVLEKVIEAGATTVNIPDTVGYAIPSEFSDTISGILKNVSNINKVVISVHCHNDLGMATANSLAAVKGGARQVECTINGIGERAGNASLEEIAMAIATRSDFFDLRTNLDIRQLIKTSRLVSHHTGMVVQPNKAIVGANAFAHSSGIHQDGFLKERSTYEIMQPEDVGLSKSKIVLTKLSGSHAFRSRLKELGLELSEEEMSSTFVKFKELADKKKEVFDEDIISLIEDEVYHIPQIFTLEYIHAMGGSHFLVPTAIVKIKKDGKVIQEVAFGNGPVSAMYLAIDQATGLKCELLDYSVKSVTGKKDAMGEVLVRVRHKDEIVSGRGVSTDTIEASAKAYMDAVNRLAYKKKKK